MLLRDIESKGNIPIYVQIEERIRAMIEAGQLQPGEQLPTIRRLASDLGVNYNTVARAYRDLGSEDMIVTKRGRGTFVSGFADEEQAKKQRQSRLKAIAAKAVDEARRLGYTPSEFAAAVVRAVSRWRQDMGQPPQ